MIIVAPAVVGAFANGITTLAMTHSLTEAKDAFITGGIAGAFAGATALGAVIGGAPSIAAGILAAGVDLGVTIANAPGGLPSGGIIDFANGLGAILKPQNPENVCK